MTDEGSTHPPSGGPAPRGHGGPEVEPGKVLLTGGFSGICGSDLHLYYAPESFPWDFSAPAELTGAQ